MSAGEKTKGLWKNPKYREHMSEVHKGHIPWNKGSTALIDKRIPSGIRSGKWGKHPTEESKEKSRIAHLGQIPWNKGKRIRKKMNCSVCSKEFSVVLSKAGERKYCSPLCSTKERAKVFKEYGWKLLFFNEVELNDDNVLVALSANSRDIGDEEVT